jgi:hypothetical protein
MSGVGDFFKGVGSGIEDVFTGGGGSGGDTQEYQEGVRKIQEYQAISGYISGRGKQGDVDN